MEAFLGIDIGSSSTKVAILNADKEIVAMEVVDLGAGSDAHDIAMQRALTKAKLDIADICYMVATGYGRINFEKANKQITEISCHAKGAFFLVEDAKTIIDIGGQDAKVIRLSDEGKVNNFVMNEKCAAGTGRFLEVMARVLGEDLNSLSLIASKATENVMINNVCTVFAESEVISRLSMGESRANVARGAHLAVAKRVMGMCNRIGYKEKVVLTGGVALNEDFVKCMSDEMGLHIEVCPNCQIVGAIGAALFAYENYYKR